MTLKKKQKNKTKLSVSCVGRSVASLYLIFTVVLSVFRVPYSDDDVGRAEVKVRMISDVVDTDILLQTDDLNNTETNVYGLFLLVPLSPTNIQTLKLVIFTSFKSQSLFFLLTDLHVVTGGVQFDPFHHTRSAFVIARLDHAVHPGVLQRLG